MLPYLVPVSDLEKRLGVDVGSLVDADLVRAQTALEDVSALVREEAGKTWVDVDDVTITAPDGVLVVARTAALRQYRNPDGYVSENIGQGAYTWSTSQDGANGAYLTADEKRIVKRAANGGGSSVYTLRTPPATYDPVSDVTGGDLLP